MKTLFKQFASKLPARWQQELKRMHFRRQIHNRTFRTDKKEFTLLEKLVCTGDSALDIGANVGHYTCRLSAIVGMQGRVIALEPVPHTFELSAANTVLLPLRNITLLNAAASDTSALVGMTIPQFDTGLDNYYGAHLSNEDTNLNVLSIKIDDLNLPKPLKLIKIDAEGH